MKLMKSMAGGMFAAALLLSPLSASAQYGNGNPPPPPGAYGQGGYGQGGYGQGGYGRPGGWDAPPNGYTRDLQRNAFRNGLDGARKDLENRRRPDVRNRDEYRNYRGPERRAYQQAFQAGYSAFWRHQGYRGY